MVLTEVWDKVSSFWKKESEVISPLDNCVHEYVHTGQQWIPIENKKWRLVDHQHCTKCKIERFIEINSGAK